MMPRTRAAILATAAAVSTAAALGTAQADPVAAPGAGVNFRTVVDNGWVTTSLGVGRFTAAHDGHSILVVDELGQTVGRLPLSIRLADRGYDVRQSISHDGRTLRLAADLSSARPVAQQVASPLENQRAANDSLAQLGLASALFCCRGRHPTRRASGSAGVVGQE